MIKLGVIGLSEGNGHPYSWSAIINGRYDKAAMDQCGYAGIPLYLHANEATLGIENAQVTHIWTQDRELSRQVAAASCIETVVDRMEDLIGRVDAVLLARDDPENHRAMAAPFIDAGIPILIDKPLCRSQDDLNYFTEQVAAGKFIISSSAMRYAAENGTVKQEFPALGPIDLATVVGKKDWIKYGIHMLEGLFALFDDPRAVAVKHVSKSGKDIVYIEFETGLLATVHLFYDIVPTFQISVFGQKGWRCIEYKNWYSMFRDHLAEFIRSVRQGLPRLDFAKTAQIIQTLLAARQSLEQNGRTIFLKQE